MSHVDFCTLPPKLLLTVIGRYYSGCAKFMHTDLDIDKLVYQELNDFMLFIACIYC